MRERIWERRYSLNRRVGKFTNIIRLTEAKDTLDLIEVDMFLDSDCVRVEVVDVVSISKNESFLHVESKSDDLLYILQSHLLYFF